MSDANSSAQADLIAVIEKRFEMIESRFDNIDRANQELSRANQQLSGEMAHLKRTLEFFELDVKMIKERDRREARVEPHDRRPRPSPETETLGDGHGSYIWQRKPAPPRLG